MARRFRFWDGKLDSNVRRRYLKMADLPKKDISTSPFHSDRFARVIFNRYRLDYCRLSNCVATVENVRYRHLTLNRNEPRIFLINLFRFLNFFGKFLVSLALGTCWERWQRRVTLHLVRGLSVKKTAIAIVVWLVTLCLLSFCWTRIGLFFCGRIFFHSFKKSSLGWLDVRWNVPPWKTTGVLIAVS